MTLGSGRFRGSGMAAIECRFKIKYDAGDHSAEALKAARWNAPLVGSYWCRCTAEPPIERTFYYRDAVGHGWGCGNCRGIVQTG